MLIDGHLSPEKIRDLIVSTLDMNKAEDIDVIDLHGISSLADYMIVASGRSTRQVSALAEKIEEKLAFFGLKNLKSEGKQQGDWVVLDCVDVLVHIFRPEVREFYKIEKMWRHTPTLSLVSDAATA